MYYICKKNVFLSKHFLPMTTYIPSKLHWSSLVIVFIWFSDVSVNMTFNRLVWLSMPNSLLLLECLPDITHTLKETVDHEATFTQQSIQVLIYLDLFSLLRQWHRYSITYFIIFKIYIYYIHILHTGPSFRMGARGDRTTSPPYDYKAEHLPDKNCQEFTILHQFVAKK